MEHIVDIKHVVVGDIALLEPGEIIPCDGIFLGGHNVKCDESGATGESDAIKKVSFDECYRVWKRAQETVAGGDPHKAYDDEMKHTDCFLVSGSKVLEGYGSYVVIAVGTKSFNGRIMMGEYKGFFCPSEVTVTDGVLQPCVEIAKTPLCSLN